MPGLQFELKYVEYSEILPNVAYLCDRISGIIFLYIFMEMLAVS